MKHNTSHWLAQLAQHTRNNLHQATQWLMLEEEELLQRPAPGKWNVLECIEHLNRYSDFYLPEFRRRIEASTLHPSGSFFKSGWLGAFFIKSMQPGPDSKKMKTFREMDPSGQMLSREVVAKFIQQQKEFLQILENAAKVDLNRIKISISITKLIRIRLGDGLAFYTVHNNRHIQQASEVLKANASIFDIGTVS
ncbi:MAG: DinB family protein [Chitinophagaceae bacterium]|nr:DinB family protein [Chitinophagaceae bacterium]